MKLKKIIMLCTFCILLSGCSKDTKSDKPTTTNQKNSSEVTNITLAPTMKPTIAPTSAVPTTTPVPEVSNVTPLPPVNLDYSDHTDPNESSYITKLADLAALKDGEPVLTTTEQIYDASLLSFPGLKVKDPVFGYDLRFADISKEDLSNVKDINDLTFNTDTIWPDKLPAGFDPKQILEYNKNPGLGIRKLHEQGITGKGVGIAIIDEALLLDHEQYKDNLMLYERIHCSDEAAGMHGAAVSSIAVGKDIGVAPGAKLYYIASTLGHYSDNKNEFDASIIADGILRVLEINRNLPEDEKIRVISISIGYSGISKGYRELLEVIDRANKENVFVITCASEYSYKDFNLAGADRDYLKDPDDVNSYEPASWITDSIYSSSPTRYKDSLLVPMGSRTIADFAGTKDYAIIHNGGASWTSPWCAGFYALCCQVKPDITIQEFIEIINSTATPVDTDHDGKTYVFGKMINPAEVIKVLQKGTN